MNDKDEVKISPKQPDGEARIWFRMDLFVPADKIGVIQGMGEAVGAREFISGPYERVWHDGRDEFRPSFERLRLGQLTTEEENSLPSGNCQ